MRILLSLFSSFISARCPDDLKRIQCENNCADELFLCFEACPDEASPECQSECVRVEAKCNSDCPCNENCPEGCFSCLNEICGPCFQHPAGDILNPTINEVGWIVMDVRNDDELINDGNLGMRHRL